MKPTFRTFFALFLCFTTYSAFSEPVETLTLADALARVLGSNPELKASELEVRAADAKILQAGFRPNPELSAEIQNLPALGSGNFFRTTEADVLIAHRLETGGKRALRVKNARMGKTVAAHSLDRVRAELAAATRQAFADVLANQERVANSRRLTELALQSRAIVLDRVSAGKTSPVEETRSEVALAAAQLEEKKQVEELTASKDMLASLWSGNSLDFARAVAEFGLPDLPPDLDACIESGPDMKLAGTSVESRRTALDLERSLRIPDIILSGGFRRSNTEDFNAWVAGISIPLPLFDKRQGAVAEARIRLEKASLEKKNLERLLRARLAQERHNYAIAQIEAKTLTKTALPAAAQALAATEEGYRLGKFEYLNVLDSQRTYAELQRKYIEAVASGQRASIEIDRLAGCDSSQPLIKEASDEK